MSDTETAIPTLLANGKHTVFFSRKISDGNYGSSEASTFIQVDTAPGASNAEIVEAVTAAYVACKSVVLTQLGIAHDLNEEGVIVEDRASLPAPTVDAVTQVRAAFGGGEVQHDSAPTGAGSGVDPTTLPKWEQEAWLKAELDRNPGAFFDNRAKKASGEYKATAPDFKHKASGLAIFPPRKK